MKCPVYLLDLYISKLPSKAVENDIFYARPLESAPIDPSAPWFAATPVGKHTLNDKVKKMCLAAGVQGNKTNHSLRATGATQMYESGVPEKIIQERTGHRSLEGLRSYERSNAQQHQAVSTILSAPQTQMYMHATYHKQLVEHTVNAQPAMLTLPGVSLQNLHGCTININQAPIPAPVPTTNSTDIIDICDAEIDKLLAEITDF